MGMFDQPARQMAKLDPPPFFEWALRRSRAALLFHSWRDARRLTFPGDPDRTNDAVADCIVAGQPEQHFIMIVEAQTEPDPDIEERVAQYALTARLEFRTGPGREDKLPVGAILINLTGQGSTTGLHRPVPGAGGCGMDIAPVVVNLSEFDAAATLTEMVAKQTGLCILPFIPLMQGGGRPGIIQEWVRVCRTETDVGRQALYAALALVFAELTRSLVDWQGALGGWNVRESQLILGWRREGKQEGIVEARRDDLLRFIRALLQDPVPDDIRLAIEGTNDPDTLVRWIDAALASRSLAEFVAALTAQP
jgi:hypothetical protein